MKIVRKVVEVMRGANTLVFSKRAQKVTDRSEGGRIQSYTVLSTSTAAIWLPDLPNHPHSRLVGMNEPDRWVFRCNAKLALSRACELGRGILLTN